MKCLAQGFNSPHLHQNLIIYIMYRGTLYTLVVCSTVIKLYIHTVCVSRNGVFFMSNYSIKLKEAREKKQIKQADIAKILDTTQQTISSYESGIRKPSLDRLIELAQILDVTLDDLVEFKKIHHRYSKKLNSKK